MIAPTTTALYIAVRLTPRQLLRLYRRALGNDAQPVNMNDLVYFAAAALTQEMPA